MERKQRSVLRLVVLCTLLLVGTTSGVFSAALSSNGRLESTVDSAGGQALEATPIPAPPLDPPGSPPDDNWDGTALGLASPPEIKPVLPSPERNLDPGAFPAAPPQLESAGPPPDDNWDGTAPGLASPVESPPVALPPDQNIAPDVSVP